MPKAQRPWIVTPHEPIEKLEDNLWAVQSAVPGLPVKRRMFIIKLTDASLMFVGAAVPLDDSALAEIRAWGRPSMLVVPHDQHMIDARGFAEKLGLKVFGPKACEAKIRARAEMAGTLEAIPPDANVRIEAVAGAKMGEPAVIVTSAGGTRMTILFSDVIQNTPKASLSLFLKILGFGGGPKVVPVFKMMFLKDKKALKSQLERWAGIKGLVRLAPCHGDAVTSDPADALRSIMPKNKEVEAWFARYENPMKEVVLRIREIILNADARMSECIKWQAPTFTFEGNLASFYPKAKQHASLMFHTGAKIPGKHPRLEGTGGTSRVLKIGSVAEANAAKSDIVRIVKAWCDWREAGAPVSAPAKRARR